jgi:hypothetical protein
MRHPKLPAIHPDVPSFFGMCRLNSSIARAVRTICGRSETDEATMNWTKGGNTLPEWQAFMSPSNGAVLVPGADERTPAQIAEDLARWWQGLAASLATAAELAGPDGFAKLIERGKDQLSAKQRMLLAHIAETRPAMRGVLGV